MDDDKAIKTVATVLSSNKLGITAKDLRGMPNPKGSGTFVYVPKTEFHGVRRLILWLVLDGKVYPLNGATRGTVTPQLPAPYDVTAEIWKKAGLYPNDSREAVAIVFGPQ